MEAVWQHARILMMPFCPTPWNNVTKWNNIWRKTNEICSICLSISLEVAPRVRSAILSVCAPLQYWQTENSILKRCLFACFDKLQSSKDFFFPLFHLEMDIWTWTRHWVGGWCLGGGIYGKITELIFLCKILCKILISRTCNPKYQKSWKAWYVLEQER